MRKNTLIIFGILLVICGCSSEKITAPFSSISPELGNALEQALKIGSIIGCNDLLDSGLKVSCIGNASYSLSQIKLDTKYCENLLTDFEKDDCRTKVIVQKAALNGDKTECDLIKNLADKAFCESN